MARNNNKGRGWFGDSARHAAAGRLGGRARGRKRKNSSESEND